MQNADNKTNLTEGIQLFSSISKTVHSKFVIRSERVQLHPPQDNFSVLFSLIPATLRDSDYASHSQATEQLEPLSVEPLMFLNTEGERL